MSRSNRISINQREGRESSVDGWYYPFVFLIGFMVVLGLLFWLFYQNNINEHRAALKSEAKTAQQAIQQRLDGNRDYILLLGMDRARGTLTPELFQERGGRYVKSHPEMINLTWVSADLFVRHVTPYEPNKQIVGLHIDLPECVIASSMAKNSRKPAYTRVFEAIQGNPSFEIWVPVFREGEFLGLFVGVYSCEGVLRHIVHPRITENHPPSLVDASGKTLFSLPHKKKIYQNLFRTVLLTPPGHETALRLDHYTYDWLPFSIIATGLICLVLMIGMAWGMWSLIQQVSTRKRAEMELQKSYNLLEAVVEGTTDAVFVKDTRGRYLMANTPALHFIGKSEGEVIGKDDAALFDPDVARQLMEVDREIMRSGEIQTVEHALTKQDGTISRLATKGPYRDHQGNVIGLVGISRDITEMKRTEQALRESEERVRLLLDSTAEGIYGLDLEGRCTLCNPAGLRLLGYDDESKLLGENMHNLIHHTRPDGTPYPKEECRIFRAFAEGKEVHVDNEIFWRAGGGSIHVEYWSYPVRKEKDIVGAVVTFVDITERKRAEKELEKHRKHLEEKVRERTAELQSIINAMSGREVRMAELKEVIRELRAQIESAGVTPVVDDPLKERSGQWSVISEE